MIEFVGVDHVVMSQRKRRRILSACDFVFPSGRVAVVARHGYERSGIADLVCGLARPLRGMVRRNGRVSWPIGRMSHLVSGMTGADTLRMLGAMYLLPYAELRAFFIEMLEDDSFLRKRLNEMPAEQRVHFALTAAIAPQFDVYVIDGPIMFSSSRFVETWYAMFERRLEGRTLILATHQERAFTTYCDKAVLVENRMLVAVDSPAEAVERVGRMISSGSAGDDNTRDEDDEAALV